MSSQEITQSYASLTKHPEGSMREIWSISLPLMVSVLSGLLMMFGDRLVLAKYSTESMNAAITAGMMAGIFIFGFQAIALIAEVFVGQHNGARQYKQVGEPTWQMLWFSLGTTAAFIFLGFVLTELFVPADLFEGQAQRYFKWIMFFGAFFPAVSSVAAFFVGLGKVRLITIAAIIANVLNIGLDILLVFGVPPFIEPMGVTGAAIATGISQATQLGVLLCFFLSEKNRTTYGTGNYQFHWENFKKYLRVGVPNAIGHMIEIAAWAILIRMMAGLSPEHITVAAIGQNLHLLFAFGVEGLKKGVTTISANIIGAKRWHMLNHVLWSGIKVLAVVVSVLFIPMVLFPDPIIQQFLSQDLPAEESAQLLVWARSACFWVWVYLFFDGVVWVVAGILTGAGDTKTVMVVNALAAWFFAILPIYIFVVRAGATPDRMWLLMNVYSTLNALCFLLRYWQGGWKTLSDFPKPVPLQP